MVAYTISDLEHQLVRTSDRLGLKFTRITYEEYILTIQLCCPRLHSTIELYNLAKNNLKTIEKEFGFKAVRIFYYDSCKGLLLQSYTGKDRLQEKYELLLEDLKKYHYNLLKEEGMGGQLDYFIYFRELEKAFKDLYGELTYFNNRLYSLVKTLNITDYKEDVVNALHHKLYTELRMSGDKYYVKQDLNDKEVLKMLFEHVAEEHFDTEIVKDYNMFTGYDGYGNEYYIHQYSSFWSDDEGHHARFGSPKHSIDDYVRAGLP